MAIWTNCKALLNPCPKYPRHSLTHAGRGGHGAQRIGTRVNPMGALAQICLLRLSRSGHSVHGQGRGLFGSTSGHVCDVAASH